MELLAAVRLATLSHGGRIKTETVDEEIERLRHLWSDPRDKGRSDLPEAVLDADRLARIDRFDRAQLAEVLRVCREASTLSEAGRLLFDVSRTQKKSANDADRLRKYLARFELSWETVKSALRECR